MIADLSALILSEEHHSCESGSPERF